MKPVTKSATPDAQLRACLATLPPKQRTLLRAVRTALRKRFPTANELAYDYGKALVIAYAPAERGIDGLLSIRASATGVALYFNNGPLLPDPKGLLRGSGRATRFIDLDSASRLTHPDVKVLIAATVAHAKVPLPREGKCMLVFKSAKK